MNGMKSYLTDLLSFTKGVRWFVWTEAFLGIGIGIFSLLLNLHMLALGLNEEEIGAVSSAGTIMMAAASIPCGMLAARFGRKKLLILGLVLMSVGYAVFATGNTIAMMYAAQLVQSVGISLLITTEIQLLYSYCASKKEETQGFSMLFAVFTLFVGMGTLAGGFLPRILGGWSTTYQGALYVAGGFLFAGAIARYALLPKESVISGGGEAAKGRFQYRLPSKAVWIFCGMNLLIGGAAAFIDPFLNVIVKFRLGWSDEGTSFLLTLNGIVLFLCSFIVPPLLDRVGISVTYRLVFIVNLITTIAMAATLPASLFSMLLLGRGGSFIMMNNLVLTHSMSALPEKDRDTFAGLRMVVRSLGSSGATYGAGVLLTGKEYGIPFLLAGLLLAAGFVYFERLVKPLFLAKLESTEQG